MSLSQKNNPRRQKWIREEVIEEAMLESVSGPPLIDTKEKLEENLQLAMVVEHFTIPPYLTALYSIKEGTNDEAVSIIRTVVVEEMLHMILVANLMNALKMSPNLKGKALIKGYPNPLPGIPGGFTVSLLKFSKESINTFLRIERPANEGERPPNTPPRSIGEFYNEIRKGIVYLEELARAEGKTIFNGDPAHQVGTQDYYGAGGNIISVANLDDAMAVIDEIEGQGEGIDGTISAQLKSEELAHYFRFNQIFYERSYKWGDEAKEPPTGEPLDVDWDCVYNMEPNPKVEKLAGYPWLADKARAFNKTYDNLLESLHETCNGNPRALREKGVPLMFQLKQQAVELMKIPSGNGNYTAGPTFESIES